MSNALFKVTPIKNINFWSRSAETQIWLREEDEFDVYGVLGNGSLLISYTEEGGRLVT